MSSSLDRISRKNTLLLVVDVQEAFRPAIRDFDKIIEKCTILVQGLQSLEVPILVSEQVPGKLGETVQELRSILHSSVQFGKKHTFSCCGTKETDPRSVFPGMDQVILCGVETHVCVQQTALDLIERGMKVVIPADATGSRFPVDRDYALQRLATIGCVITTTESLLFELLTSSDNEHFKQISRLVKERRH